MHRITLRGWDWVHFSSLGDPFSNFQIARNTGVAVIDSHKPTVANHEFHCLPSKSALPRPEGLAARDTELRQTQKFLLPSPRLQNSEMSPDF
jgi:hypothetical protein